MSNLQDLRSLTENVAIYSGELAAENRELKRFLFEHYRHFRVVRMAVKAERMLSNLFRLHRQPHQLPKGPAPCHRRGGGAAPSVTIWPA